MCECVGACVYCVMCVNCVCVSVSARVCIVWCVCELCIVWCMCQHVFVNEGVCEITTACLW
jgi:hypothetical protein